MSKVAGIQGLGEVPCLAPCCCQFPNGNDYHTKAWDLSAEKRRAFTARIWWCPLFSVNMHGAFNKQRRGSCLPLSISLRFFPNPCYIGHTSPWVSFSGLQQDLCGSKMSSRLNCELTLCVGLDHANESDPWTLLFMVTKKHFEPCDGTQ